MRGTMLPVVGGLSLWVKLRPFTESINHERMPVLLSTEDGFEIWLKAPVAEAFALAQSYYPERMRIVQSGREKRDLLGAELPMQGGIQRLF